MCFTPYVIYGGDEMATLSAQLYLVVQDYMPK
jgi:hypothetical protein